MNYQIMETKNVTPPYSAEEAENGDVRKVEEVVLLMDDEPDSFEVAYHVFKNAKYVVELGQEKLKMLQKIMVKYRITYPSPSERFESMAYGED